MQNISITEDIFEIAEIKLDYKNGDLIRLLI